MMRLSLRALMRLTFGCVTAFSLSLAQAEVAHIAVAANFTAPAKALAAILERDTDHQAQLSFGATGAFYTQIKNGAPFDVLLGADNVRTARLEAEGDTVADTRFVYATGQLVLWSTEPDRVDAQGQVLRNGDFRKLALANPKLAPYGAAAVQTLNKLGLYSQLEPQLVTGESIGQTHNFIATGNAELGFVALSQVLEDGQLKSGSMWVVPADMHDPIVQEAVLLKRAADNPAARAWLDLLQSPEAKELIRSFGYAVD